MAAPQSSQAFVIPAVFPLCPLFPPQHSPVPFPTSVGHAEMGMKLSLPLGHPVLFPKTSVPPKSQICFGWKDPGNAGARWRLCPAIMGQCQSLSITIEEI